MRVFFFRGLIKGIRWMLFFLSFFFYMSICWKCLPEFVANIKNKRKGKKKKKKKLEEGKKREKKKKKKGCKAPRPGYTGLSAGSALRFFFYFYFL